MTPTEIARVVGRSVGRVSNLLAALRLADVVRCKTVGGRTMYRLKHSAETRRLLNALADFVAAAGRGDFSDFRNSEKLKSRCRLGRS